MRKIRIQPDQARRSVEWLCGEFTHSHVPDCEARGLSHSLPARRRDRGRQAAFPGNGLGLSSEIDEARPAGDKRQRRQARAKRPVEAGVDLAALSGSRHRVLRVERTRCGRKRKQKHRSRPLDQEVFWFAGLWGSFHAKDGQPVGCFTIITTSPYDVMKPIHNRMPVILTESGVSVWMDLETADPLRVLCPYPGPMEAERV